MMVMTNASHANQGNQGQERPLRKAATNGRNLSTIANCAVDLILLEDLHIGLLLLRGNLSSGYKRGRDCFRTGAN